MLVVRRSERPESSQRLCSSICGENLVSLARRKDPTLIATVTGSTIVAKPMSEGLVGDAQDTRDVLRRDLSRPTRERHNVRIWQNDPAVPRAHAPGRPLKVLSAFNVVTV